MIVDEKVALKSLKTEFAIANFQRLHSAVEAAEKMMADWSDKEDDNIDMIILQQKQPSIGALIKRCSKNMQQIYWRTVSLKSHVHMDVLHVNLLHIFRTPFPKNTSGRLLLLPPVNVDVFTVDEEIDNDGDKMDNCLMYVKQLNFKHTFLKSRKIFLTMMIVLILRKVKNTACP